MSVTDELLSKNNERYASSFNQGERTASLLHAGVAVCSHAWTPRLHVSGDPRSPRIGDAYMHPATQVVLSTR